MNLLSDSFLENLPEDPLEALHSMAVYLKDTVLISPLISTNTKQIAVNEAIEFIIAFANLNQLELEAPKRSVLVMSGVIPGMEGHESITKLRDICESIDKLYSTRVYKTTLLKAKQFSDRLELKRAKALATYTLSDSEHSRAQELINQLRDEVSTASYLTDEHKLRIQKRLEGIQRELHKTMSDLDKFWGLCVDASVVMRKCGENAKPFVDRVRELADIFGRVMSKTENLPYTSPFKLLE
jgi:hypothetical protein